MLGAQHLLCQSVATFAQVRGGAQVRRDQILPDDTSMPVCVPFLSSNCIVVCLIFFILFFRQQKQVHSLPHGHSDVFSANNVVK